MVNNFTLTELYDAIQSNCLLVTFSNIENKSLRLLVRPMSTNDFPELQFYFDLSEYRHDYITSAEVSYEYIYLDKRYYQSANLIDKYADEYIDETISNSAKQFTFKNLYGYYKYYQKFNKNKTN